MKHDVIEKNIGSMLVLMTFAISLGGLAEIVPLFFSHEVTTPVKGLKRLNPVELEGRDIYIREGCHVCHSQMIRPLRAETERYGHYSVAGEHVYEHPFLWGSKRTGPDVARLGGRYSDDWHKLHMYNPRDVVPESVMPSYPWLFSAKVDGSKTANKMRALRVVGVPYTDDDIEGAEKLSDGVLEIDALISYLQQLGTVITHRR